jgi:hypothetical protein
MISVTIWNSSLSIIIIIIIIIIRVHISKRKIAS